MPLVVIDVHEKVAQDPDYTLTMDDIKAWEKKYGRIPSGSFVAMRTDWSKRWPDADAMANKDADGIAHYPGWSMPVLQYLYEERGITASGHEPTDTDPGIATSQDDYSLEASDRAASQSRSSSGVWCAGGGVLSQARRWFRFSGPRLCHSAVGLIANIMPGKR